MLIVMQPDRELDTGPKVATVLETTLEMAPMEPLDCRFVEELHVSVMVTVYTVAFLCQPRFFPYYLPFNCGNRLRLLRNQTNKNCLHKTLKQFSFQPSVNQNSSFKKLSSWLDYQSYQKHRK